MFRRPRSPGSTLKPLLYALAIDRGLALPGYLVADVPSEYGTYRPKNFDNDWAGLVRLQDALAKSLNLPFVDLLDRFGVDAFVGELQRLGVAQRRTRPGDHGLSLIAGSIELTPLELAAIYATLAGDGIYRPLRVTASAPHGAPVRVFGAAAAQLTREALALRDRPDLPRRRDPRGLPREIHWKTGTSYGLKDAWSAGSGPAYTAVVWTGNVDMTPSGDLIGSEAAAPILFDVLEGLAERARRIAPSPPAPELIEIEVCAYSGHVPGDACEHKVAARAPVHAVPTAPCPYHQAYDVDRAGRAVLPACRRDGETYTKKTFVVLPSAITAFLAERHRAIPAAPEFAEGCAPDLGGRPPVMISPAEGQVVTLIPGLPARQQVIGLAASTRAATVTWFVDGELVGTAPANERVYWVPTKGTHSVVVSDEAGRKARRKLVVR
jgi:penicillin-binding protein 1C